MRNKARISVIIPTLNEERSIGHVLDAIPSWGDDIVVVDNGSTDGTTHVAQQRGARVIHEPHRGYGTACLKGIAALKPCDIVVFLDGDFSDYPEEMYQLVDPVCLDGFDMVIGSRVLGTHEPGALTPQARFGNWLSCALIRLFWGYRFTDLGPFRAIRYSALSRLNMQDRNYGWTVEMQIKAARNGLKVCEVPVSYRKRIGISKISGTLKGVLCAGTKILYTIFKAAWDTRGSQTNAGNAPQTEAVFTPGPRNGKDKLVVFTRYPEPGTTKTRLIPHLGEESAAVLQRRMTTHVLNRVRDCLYHLESRQAPSLLKCQGSDCLYPLESRQPPSFRNCQDSDGRHRGARVSAEIRFEGGSIAQLRRLFGSDFLYRPQEDGDLGDRLHRAFRESFESGAGRVVIIGTDCPGISEEIISEAFNRLRRDELVLGPAEDGGYYLVGLTRAVPELFSDIPWGTATVLDKTIAAASRSGVSVTLLDRLGDVDRPGDLHLWNKAEKETVAASGLHTISVIIPTINESRNLDAVLKRLLPVSTGEVVVVDGGSTDGTTDVARRHGVRLITSALGRARQMNAGAAASSGRILVFLHADTVLPDEYCQYIRHALSRPGVTAGAFELKIGSRGGGLRLCERLVNWRSHWLGLPYGDQAFFMTRAVFDRTGGFPEIVIMEDVEMVRRLKRVGRMAIVPVPVETSPRRWQKRGLLLTTLINQMVMTGFYLGVPLGLLSRLYGRNV